MFDRAVAEKGDADVIGPQQLETVTGPGGLQNAGADDAAGAHHADLRSEQVHAAAAAARTAGGPAKQLGEQLPRRHPLGQGMAMAAMRAEDHVFLAQVRTHANGDRLLSDIGVAGPVNQAALMRPCQLLLTQANEQHAAVQGQELVLAPGGFGLGQVFGHTVHRDHTSSLRGVGDSRSV